MFGTTSFTKTIQEISHIRDSGKYLNELLHDLYVMCKPGISTMELEVYAERYLLSHNLVGAFKGYGGFPTNLCVSNNDCVVHGVPSQEELREGDVLKVDCGINYKGGISDAAFTIVVGGNSTNTEGARLITATKKVLDEGIKVIRSGVVGKTYGKEAKQIADREDISIIRNLTGHGVGNDVHEPPHIYNWPQNSMKKWKFQKNMVMAIEPITAFTSDSYTERPGMGHNLYTSDGDLGAQREYTLLVTDEGVEILAGLNEIPG